MAARLRAPPEGLLRGGRVRQQHGCFGAEAAQAQQRVHAHHCEQRVPDLRARSGSQTHASPHHAHLCQAQACP